jgi:hypothetical protein
MSNNPMDAKRIQAYIAAKSWKDPAFKRQLLANPRAVLEKECGVKLPDGVECKVLEETAKSTYIILPMQPDDVTPDQLSDAELETVAGGAASKTDVRSGCVCCGKTVASRSTF